MTVPPAEALTLIVDMEPVGRRAEMPTGSSLLDAAQAAGIGLVSLCGGEGWCESCIVRLASGELSPVTAAEREVLSAEKLAAGYRLACQAVATQDVKIEIPPESLTTPQRLQVEGLSAQVVLDPPVESVNVVLDPPSFEDMRPDRERLEDALAGAGHANVSLSYPVLVDLSSRLRDLAWSVQVVLRKDQGIAILPPEVPIFGLAVDIGTTKLAAYLVDLATGETSAQAGAMNPQIAYGEDILSRIGYCEEHKHGRPVLQARLAATLNDLIRDMCAEVGVTADQIVEAVAVGNTAMHHIFAGLGVGQLAMTPYVPTTSQSLEVAARDVGLEIARGACAYLLPNIAGYVGADHTSVILVTDIWKTDRISVAVDIGTNTEITLAANGRLSSCSCASGPAFEGAHIRDGMRAADGAIERVQIKDDQIRVYTIGGKPPVGICGSGILDAVAEMRRCGILDNKGALQENHPRVRQTDQLPELVLVPAAATGHGRDITLNRKDVNEIQLAKGAIRTGLELLLLEAGIGAEEVQDFIIAGAFGTYISIPSAICVGMFPDLPLGRFRQVGNAAGMGAKQALISLYRRRVAQDIVKQIKYIELTTHPAFQRQFMRALFL
jgi:uncharacterized 2Fe-2S/4Fe-4S cluster protein (DUF4445 family)